VSALEFEAFLRDYPRPLEARPPLNQKANYREWVDPSIGAARAALRTRKGRLETTGPQRRGAKGQPGTAIRQPSQNRAHVTQEQHALSVG